LLAGEYVVEQYKSRAGTWSIGAIQGDILRGLRRAIRPVPPTKVAYRFVTNGHPGRGVPQLFEFFERLKLVATSAQIDDSELYDYDGDVLTDAALFRHIWERSRSVDSPESSNEPERVSHLLTQFEADWEYSIEALTAKIDGLLRLYFPESGDLHMARANLLGSLVQRLKPGLSLTSTS
jgi:hypothetical protein